MKPMFNDRQQLSSKSERLLSILIRTRQFQEKKLGTKPTIKPRKEEKKRRNNKKPISKINKLKSRRASNLHATGEGSWKEVKIVFLRKSVRKSVSYRFSYRFFQQFF
jgi:hypothetical protein